MKTAMRLPGSCHCGAVKFRVETHLSRMIECNCSYCFKRGTLLTFVGPRDFVVDQGEEALTEYRFNTRTIQHLFCSICGVAPFGRGVAPDGREMIAINARCLDAIDLTDMPREPFDGRSL